MILINACYHLVMFTVFSFLLNMVDVNLFIYIFFSRIANHSSIVVFKFIFLSYFVVL